LTQVIKLDAETKLKPLMLKVRQYGARIIKLDTEERLGREVTGEAR
jgi:hypothetical protein